MPLIGTRGAASSRGFGRFGGKNTIDPYWDLVTLLIPGRGTNGSSNIVDVKNGYSISVGSTRISTTYQKFGTGSVYAPGGDLSTNGLIVNNDYYGYFTGDFTVEGWFLFPVKTNSFPIFGQMTNGNWQSQVWESGDNWGVYQNGSPGWQVVNTTFELNTWHFLSICRTGGTIHFHQNGAYLGGANSNGAIPLCSPGPSGGGGGGVLRMQGYNQGGPAYMQDFRVTNGACRYTTSSYAVPTAALPQG